MTLQAQHQDQPAAGDPQGGDRPAGTTPPSGLRDVGAAPPRPPPAAPPAGASPPAGAPAAPPRPTTSSLPPEALSARLARERRAALRELGIEDPVAFKKQREAEQAELARLKEQEEAGKRAQMSELQRIQADLEAERAARQAADAKVRELEEIRVAHEQEQVVRSNALRYVDPEMYDYARVDFQRHVRELERRDPKKLAAMGEDEIDRFFKDLVKKKPRLAPTPPAGSPPAGAPPKVETKQPLARPGTPPRAARPTPPASRVGAPPPRQPPAPAAPPSPTNGKTIKPGMPNSMSKQELDAELRRQGRRPW